MKVIEEIEDTSDGGAMGDGGMSDGGMDDGGMGDGASDDVDVVDVVEGKISSSKIYQEIWGLL